MNESRRVYRFTDFVLDPERRELTGSGHEIELQPRVFDLLLYLVHHRDRAVDKDELMAAVWPGMVVTETALTRAVMKARKALNDDAGAQAMIKTVHGHGYRFVASVSTELSGSAPEAGPGDTRAQIIGTEGIARRLRTWMVVVVLLVVFIVTAYVTASRWNRDDRAVEAPRVAVLPVVDVTGDAEMGWARLGLMSFVSGLLTGDQEIDAVADGDMLTAAEGQGEQALLDPDAARGLLERLHSLYGASHLLEIEMQSEHAQLRMNYRLWDLDGKARRGTMVGADAPELAVGVVQGVYGYLLGRARMGGQVEAVSSDPFNNEAFARGMSLSLEGRCADAEGYFRVILEQEPELFAPRHELAACLRILGRTDEAEATLLDLVQAQRALGADRQLAQAAMTLGVLYNRTGRLDLAWSSHEEALAAARRVQDHEQAGRVLNNLAIVAKDRGQPDEAHDLLDRAILEYRQGGREILPGHVHSLQANLAMGQGRLAEADGYLQQALEAFRASGDRRYQAMMLNNTGYLRRLQGRLGEAETYHLQSMAIREEIGDRVGVGRILNMLAVVYAAQGKYADAKTAAMEGIEIARASSDRLFEATLQAQLGDAERGLGDRSRARAAFAAARGIFEQIEDHSRLLEADLKLAALDLDEGRLVEASETVAAVLISARQRNFLKPELDAMEMQGDIAALESDPEAAETAWLKALERVRETSWQGKETRLCRKLADLAMDRGDLPAAEPLVGRLAAVEADFRSLLTQARFARMSGDSERAKRLTREAKQIAGDDWTEVHEALLQDPGGSA